jgi:hypothetical protein
LKTPNRETGDLEQGFDLEQGLSGVARLGYQATSHVHDDIDSGAMLAAGQARNLSR